MIKRLFVLFVCVFLVCVSCVSLVSASWAYGTKTGNWDSFDGVNGVSASGWSAGDASMLWDSAFNFSESGGFSTTVVLDYFNSTEVYYDISGGESSIHGAVPITAKSLVFNYTVTNFFNTYCLGFEIYRSSNDGHAVIRWGGFSPLIDTPTNITFGFAKEGTNFVGYLAYFDNGITFAENGSLCPIVLRYNYDIEASTPDWADDTYIVELVMSHTGYGMFKFKPYSDDDMAPLGGLGGGGWDIFSSLTGFVNYVKSMLSTVQSYVGSIFGLVGIVAVIAVPLIILAPALFVLAVVSSAMAGFEGAGFQPLFNLGMKIWELFTGLVGTFVGAASFIWNVIKFW